MGWRFSDCERFLTISTPEGRQFQIIDSKEPNKDGRKQELHQFLQLLGPKHISVEDLYYFVLKLCYYYETQGALKTWENEHKDFQTKFFKLGSDLSICEKVIGD
jgi:hypothetical protein